MVDGTLLVDVAQVCSSKTRGNSIELGSREFEGRVGANALLVRACNSI